ncbi:iron ABC transporter permease [uncultured Clostridium sp.]|uniref:FecCD family ABC transporter permease n=1 Tax=uncultured Clostridium sp. TaxID=59620 RepID=UPI0026347028|nr:iron ABC transporter permease [uncultured Clostridium sp.]
MKTNKKFLLWTIFLILILMIVILLGITFGSTKIEIKIVWKFLRSKISGTNIEGLSSATEAIIWQIRFPRTLLAAITGGSLALCGILMQCITKNSIADPYILGISSGASAGAVSVIVLGGSFLGSIGIAGGAFIGGLICGILVFVIGTRCGKVSSTTRLILAGMALSTIFAAITNLLIYSAENGNQAKSAMFWIMGSLGGAKWEILLLPGIVFIIALGISIFLSKSLDLLLFGEESAIMLGMNVKVIKSIIIIVAVLLIAVIVSLTGAIGFIGLIIPHIIRNITGSNHKRLIILSVLLGAIFLIIADILARVIFAPREIPIGIVTALIGGPFFLWLIGKKDYSFGGNK